MKCVTYIICNSCKIVKHLSFLYISYYYYYFFKKPNWSLGVQEYCSQYVHREDERPLKVSRFLEVLTVSQNFILILIFLKINTIRPFHAGMHCNTPKDHITNQVISKFTVCFNVKSVLLKFQWNKQIFILIS